MSNQNYPIPPVPSSSPPSGGVRRYHTITAPSRSARNAAKEVISEESPDQASPWNDDEPVGEDWVGGIGVVGEKTSLHRQASLPTRYNRAFHGSKSGTATPKTVNSLAAIAGHEGDEEPWNISSYGAEEDQTDAQSASPHSNSNSPVPTSGGAAVRRHVSLNTPAAGPRRITGLKRSDTLQTPRPHPSNASPDPPQTEEAEYVDSRDQYDEYYSQNYPTSPVGRQSPWTPGSNDWRNNPGPVPNQNTSIDDVQIALSALDIASNSAQPLYYNNYGGVGAGQSVHPPRFNPPHPPPLQPPGAPRYNQNNNLRLMTDVEGRKTPLGAGLPRGTGPNSASSSYFPANTQRQNDERGANWEPRERSLSNKSSNTNIQQSYHNKNASSSSVGSGAGNGNGGIPSVPPIPAQYLQQQPNRMLNNNQQNLLNSQQLANPVDIPTLIATKGYNPNNFDIKPAFARYFVIKSYTEDDVHKSLKYEIWSSTDPGNKRLDKAFKEVNNRGPIYLFFSVNASGHFCGMAEMITAVDYTRSSTVWASDKWKGIFKVRWIFVRDIPNSILRHIKLNNTQERKSVTNSRDTQELLPDAGQEMLRIFYTHPSRTSLLQDYAFYELQALQKNVQSSAPGSPPQSASQSVIHSPQMQATIPAAVQQNPFGMPYQIPAMSMMMGYGQANPGLGYPSPGVSQTFTAGSIGGYSTGQGYTQGSQGYGGNQAYGQGNTGYGSQAYGSQANSAQAQAMHQSVMRHPSPTNQSGFF